MGMGNPYTSIGSITSTSALKDRVKRAAQDSTRADRRREIVRDNTSGGTSSHSVLIASTTADVPSLQECTHDTMQRSCDRPHNVSSCNWHSVGPDSVPDTAQERAKELTKIFHAMPILISLIDPVACTRAIRALKG